MAEDVAPCELQRCALGRDMARSNWGLVRRHRVLAFHLLVRRHRVFAFHRGVVCHSAGEDCPDASGGCAGHGIGRDGVDALGEFWLDLLPVVSKVAEHFGTVERHRFRPWPPHAWNAQRQGHPSGFALPCPRFAFGHDSSGAIGRAPASQRTRPRGGSWYRRAGRQRRAP